MIIKCEELQQNKKIMPVIVSLTDISFIQTLRWTPLTPNWLYTLDLALLLNLLRKSGKNMWGTLSPLLTSTVVISSGAAHCPAVKGCCWTVQAKARVYTFVTGRTHAHTYNTISANGLVLSTSCHLHLLWVCACFSMCVYGEKEASQARLLNWTGHMHIQALCLNVCGSLTLTRVSDFSDNSTTCYLSNGYFIKCSDKFISTLSMSKYVITLHGPGNMLSQSASYYKIFCNIWIWLQLWDGFLMLPGKWHYQSNLSWVLVLINKTYSRDVFLK